MTKEIYGSKATITFTMQQAIDFITEKLQDDFSSDFKFSVSIQDAAIEIPDNSCNIPDESQKSLDNPEAISDNPWLIPDEDGWFLHDPEYIKTDCPSYIQSNKSVLVQLRGRNSSQSGRADRWGWSVEDIGGDIVKWKYT